MDLVIGAALLAGLATSSLYSTTLFHLLTGMAVAVSAFVILAVTVSARRLVATDAYPEFLGIALGFTAVLYLMRGLTFARLGAGAPSAGNLTSQLSLAAQYLSSASLLWAPLLIGRRSRSTLAVALYAVLTALLVATIFWWHLFPVCRLADGSLTAFKRLSELGCGLALLGAIGLTVRRRAALDPVTRRLMMAALCCATASAFVLALQSQFASPVDVLGHLLFVAAVFFICVAVTWGGLTQPATLAMVALRQRGEQAEAARRKALVGLRASEQARRTLLAESPFGIVVCDRRLRISECNTAAAEMLGLTRGDLLAPGNCPESLLQAAREALEGRATAYEGSRHGADAERGPWVSGRVSPLLGHGGKVSGIMLAVSDTTTQTNAEGLIERLAFHDALTELPNRTLLRDRLRQAIAAAERSGGQIGLAVVDIDHFKKLNDALGQGTGDALLREVGARLSAVVRTTDTVARSGGDEFAVLMPELHRARDARLIAEKLIAALRRPWEFGGDTLQLSGSAGIALWPDDAADAQALLENAHSAMRRAKELGRDSYQFFDLALALRTTERLALERELRRAIDEDQLEVYYQPQVDLHDGRIVGFEALVRWQHPQRGLISPDEFIALAEESGLIEPLDLFVARSATCQIAAWQRLSGRPLRLAINVSARRLQGRGLLPSIENALADAGLEPSQLEVELTETAIMADAEVALEVLVALRKLGLSVALDDFGTGFSSLAHLQALPITTVKIDRSFVTKVGEDANAAAIVSAIARLGCDLNLRVVAEGVETASQLDFVRQAGCHEAQGYLFAKPLPAPECEALLVGSGKRLTVALADR